MDVQVDGWSNEKLEQFIAENGVKCPECGKKSWQKKVLTKDD